MAVSMFEGLLHSRLCGLAVVSLFLLTGSRSRAVVFSSTGDATYNTTAPTGNLAGSGWQWQGTWVGATGTPIAPHFFITAGHLGGNVGDIFLFNGVNYVTIARNASPTSDLIVWQVSGTFPTYAPMYTGSAEVGMSAVLFGRGVARGNAVNVAGLGEDPLRGWTWASSATAGTLRWGENTIDLAPDFPANLPYPANGQLLVMDFDRYDGTNPNEVTLANMDSGGGLFIRDPVDNQWKLAGINVDAEYAFRYTLAGGTFNASIVDIGGLYYDEAGDVVGPPGTDPFVLAANGTADIAARLYSVRISANVAWILGVPGFPLPNNAPQIGTVADQTTDPLVPLPVNLTGSDADVPAQVLTYSLVNGPVGMTVTAGGVLTWTPDETLGGTTVPVTVKVTDNGVPALSATTQFQVMVRTASQPARTVWQLGDDAPTGSSGAVSYAEFSMENGLDDVAPGLVTRLAEDPQYVGGAGNPGADDDFYFAGVYPPGFNRLTTTLTVPNDEPFSAWERAHTLKDLTNRIHFVLGGAQASSATAYRLRVDIATGGSKVGNTYPPGFSEHDYVIRFRNGAGVTSQVYSNRLTQVTNLILDFTAGQVSATAGGNSLEFVRTGPSALTGYWLTYDQVRLEVMTSNTPPQIGAVADQTTDPLVPVTVNLTGSDADVPAQALVYSLVNGPAGMTVTTGGVLTWTPDDTLGGTTVPVTVRVTDNGVPAMSATTQFQVTVRTASQPSRSVWQLGEDAPTGSSGAVSYGEFSMENGLNDVAPGLVTRLPGDPQYAGGAGNPGADDDFYFAGVYPPGFNRLTSTLSVPNDEPFSAWERAHTLKDLTNRIHFVLGGAQASSATAYRLRVDIATGGSKVGTTYPPGFSEHDYVIRFRNGAGATSLVYSNRLTQVTNLILDFTAGQVSATSGGNSLELVRTGPSALTGYWLTYDQVRLEVMASNSAPQIGAVADQTTDPLVPLTVNLTGSDADVPTQVLTYSLVNGPVGMTVTTGGALTWTPDETLGGTTVPVTVKVTDNGVPALSATTQFQVTVRAVSQSARTVWQLGDDAPTGSSGAVSYAEFSMENGVDDVAPGLVTRLPGDPQYVSGAGNPGADDDFYFAGVYPPGFNRLTSTLSVPNDEPFSAWERAHTLKDLTNRIHFVLGWAQALSATAYRLRVDIATGGSRVGNTYPPGFSEHDYVIRFRNGAGVTSQVYSNRLTQVTNLILDFTAGQVSAMAGGNSLELVRTGPSALTGYWLTYDQVRLEVMGVEGLGFARSNPARVGSAVTTGAFLKSAGASGAGSITGGEVVVRGVSFLTLTYVRPEPAPAEALYRVEASSDLVHWSVEDVSPLTEVMADGWTTVTVRDGIPLGNGSSRFLRVRVLTGSAGAGSSAF